MNHFDMNLSVRNEIFGDSYNSLKRIIFQVCEIRSGSCFSVAISNLFSL